MNLIIRTTSGRDSIRPSCENVPIRVRCVVMGKRDGRFVEVRDHIGIDPSLLVRSSDPKPFPSNEIWVCDEFRTLEGVRERERSRRLPTNTAHRDRSM